MIDLSTIQALLADDDVNAAWRLARAALAADPAAGLALAAAVGPRKWRTPVADALGAAAASPSDPDRLYAAGKALVEVGDPQPASAILSYARQSAPGSTPILLELVAAFELAGDHPAARAALAGAAPEHMEDPLVRFLYGFHEVLAAAPPPSLSFDGDGPLDAHLRARWSRLLGRYALFPANHVMARLLVASGTLALRGAMSAGPHVPAETARVWSLAAGAMASWGATGPVGWLPGDHAEDIARGLADRLDTEARPYGGEPGVVVLADLADLIPERAAALRDRSDVLIYADRADCDREHPLAPDLLGLYAPSWQAPADDPFADPPAWSEVPRTPIAAEPRAWGTWRAADAQVGPCSTPRERLWAGLFQG